MRAMAATMARKKAPIVVRFSIGLLRFGSPDRDLREADQQGAGDGLMLSRSMILSGARRNLPIFVLCGLTAASLAGLLLLPAIPQEQSYQLFADCRAAAGIPNFWNIVSNIPFIAIGAAGLWRFRDSPATIVLFLGFLSPASARLTITGTRMTGPCSGIGCR